MEIKKKKEAQTPYSNLFIASFAALVKTRNQFIKWKESIDLIQMRMKADQKSEMQVFSKFEELIPYMESYNKKGILHQLHLQCSRKGYRTLEDYYNAIVDGKEKLDEIKGNITFVGSHFFRGDVWQELRKQCMAAFAKTEKEKIRIWCAGCSSGKEVYSILMTLAEEIPVEKIELLATDYNQEMLRRCREGCYPLGTMREIPEQYRYCTERYIPKNRKGIDFSYRYQFRFRESLRNAVTTKHLNLITDDFPGGFDLILCRNVIKFFEEDVRREVQRKLTDSLNEGGFLVVSDELEAEGIKEPEKLHVRQIPNSCIYIKKDN